MKIIYSLLFYLFFAGNISAQLLKVTAGTDVTVLSGTVFTVDSLTLTPSSDFTLSNVTVSKSTTIIHPSLNKYISRVYQFSNTSNPFSGAIIIKYLDGAELNGINEADLNLNVYNGTGWQAYNATTRDGTNNFVLTNGLTGVSLNELTLASQFAPLPVTWLSFTATKENQTVFLQWSTAQEQNTQSYLVQHSEEGINWVTIASLPAAGNSSNTNNYNYVHTNPVTGMNYYRIEQTDADHRSSYSLVRTILFTNVVQPFDIISNPVTNGILVVKVYIATQLSLYTAEGKLLWKQQQITGLKNIDVSRYAKGNYFLRSDNYTKQIVIQ